MKYKAYFSHLREEVDSISIQNEILSHLDLETIREENTFNGIIDLTVGRCISSSTSGKYIVTGNLGLPPYIISAITLQLREKNMLDKYEGISKTGGIPMWVVLYKSDTVDKQK